MDIVLKSYIKKWCLIKLSYVLQLQVYGLITRQYYKNLEN